MTQSTDYQTELRQQILDADRFVEATFQGVRKGHHLAVDKVILRPVVLKNGRFIQRSTFANNRHIAKNLSPAELAAQLDDLLGQPFKQLQVLTTTERIHVQITKKGKAIVHRDPHDEPMALPVLSHDRPKETPLPDDRPVPFLQAVGIMTRAGKVKANRRRKFRQINQFVTLVDETAVLTDLTPPIRLVDFGCGNAYLTFALYHYLHETLGVETHLTGIDIREDLMARHNQTAQELGWTNVHFLAQPIEQYQPDTPPDIVVALHACDTATDDALAQGVRSQSRFIFSAPCCHHHLQAQLNAQETPPVPFGPLLGQGILKERLGDLLTDTFRALILRGLGYRTDVIEFIDTQHTPRNLMIRAIRSPQVDQQTAVAEYGALKQFWQVTPYLETLLADELAEWDR